MRSIFKLGLQVLECEKNVSKNGIVGFEIWKTKLKPRPKELKQKKVVSKLEIEIFLKRKNWPTL
jgi:hypothetical protein